MQYSRRLTTDVTAPDSGIAKYSRTLGIEEDMLFLVTLAGVFVVMAGILALFGIAYFASGFFMSREDFMVKFFDKVIGLELLILILSQYTIGVTGTYQIYHSVELHEATDPKCILAAVSLLFLAFGIIVYGYVIVKKHEEEIRDVGTVAHMKKPVNARYGPLYDEYKFKNRFFFAPKLMVALLTGCATGYVGAEATYQVSFILAVHVIFFFYLEIKSPHHSRFVQTTTSFVTIMKIAVLVLTFFLISAAAADGFPSELQNGISLAIVGLNLFVLFLLMIRSLYSFWKKYQLQRDAKFDQEDEQTAQEYFKDETPVQKERVPLAPQNSQYQQQQSQNQQYQQQSQPQQQRYSSNVANSTHNPYVNGNANEYNIDDDDNKYTEDIRLRSGTHMQEAAPSNYDSRSYDVNRRTAANHYITDENADYERRNNVVEL
uniref:TRP C-terminal domain-containing protein n=1 Tax=Globisporangium ultimum (strain ATCC 200006 / CBS 805.95 / DAOM BR144) TaxID=431595 RepID=K3W6P3_GLOUD